MTSRLTLSAILFSILSTAALVGAAEADTTTSVAAPMRVVQLERVVVTASRIAPDA